MGGSTVQVFSTIIALLLGPTVLYPMCSDLVSYGDNIMWSELEFKSNVATVGILGGVQIGSCSSLAFCPCVLESRTNKSIRVCIMELELLFVCRNQWMLTFYFNAGHGEPSLPNVHTFFLWYCFCWICHCSVYVKNVLVYQIQNVTSNGPNLKCHLSIVLSVEEHCGNCPLIECWDHFHKPVRPRTF